MRQSGSGRSEKRIPGDLRADSIVFVAFVVLGVLLRALIAHSGAIAPNGDEATGMIMAQRASQGHLLLVFPTQNYGGALLSWLEGALIDVFGFHIMLFWVVETGLAVVGAVLLRAVAASFIRPMAAAAAGGLFLFFSAPWTVFSSEEFIFYVPGILFSLGAAWMVIRWFKSPNLWMAGAFGVLAGLALWCYPLMACLVIPPGAALLWGVRTRAAHLGAVVGGFLLGVAPWAAVFAITGSHALHSLDSTQSHATVFKIATTVMMPIGLGLRDSAVIGWTIYTGCLVCLVVFAIQRRIELVCCAASVVLWPIVLTLARVPALPGAYRYTFMMAPAVLILVCYLASVVRLAVILTAAVLVWTGHSMSVQTHGFAAASNCPQSYRAVGRYLVGHGRTNVWGSYWVASPLAVCDYPQLTVGVAAEKGDAVSAHAAAAAPASTYVVGAGQALDIEISRWVGRHDRRAARTTVDNFAVWSLTQKVLPQTMDFRGAF